MDYRRLICPRPPSPIFRHGCNTSGRSLPHAPPTGCLRFIKNSIPRPMLVVPFVTKNGFNEPLVKTNRLLGYCLRTHTGGPSFLGFAPAQNAPTWIGSGRSTPCGKMSAITSRRQPTNAISTRKPLVNGRRPIVTNNSLMSVPPTNARRPSIVNGFSTRRLHVALWPNALLLHDR